MVIETNSNVAMIRISPTSVVPAPLIIAHFAHTAGYDEWTAVVIGGRIAIVREIWEGRYHEQEH